MSTDWITPELKQLMAAMGGWAPPTPEETPDDLS